MLPSCSGILVESICTTIRPEFKIPTDLFLLQAHDHSTRIYGPLSFNLSFLHNHSTKNQGPHCFISLIWTQPFDKNIWSSFIYSFFCARPFDEKLMFYNTPIYFLICTQPFNQKLQCPHYFLYFICTRPFDQKLGSSLINFFHLHTTILPNYRVLFHLFFLHCPTIRLR